MIIKVPILNYPTKNKSARLTATMADNLNIIHSMVMLVKISFYIIMQNHKKMNYSRYLNILSKWAILGFFVFHLLIYRMEIIILTSQVAFLPQDHIIFLICFSNNNLSINGRIIVLLYNLLPP